MTVTTIRRDIDDDDIATELTVHNVVTSGKLGHFLDLDEIAASLPEGETDFETFRGIIYRMDSPEAVLVMYAKGTIVTLYAKSVEESVEAIRKAIDMMRRLSIVVNPEPTITVHNVVATAVASSRINLELASMTLEHTLYEPQHFPGLLYRPDQGVAICIFGQGKMTITGVKTESEAEGYVRETVRRLADLGCMGGCQ